MSISGYQVYKNTGIATASPQRLVYLLYNEAYKQANLAIGDLKAKRFCQTNARLQKVQDIFTELMSTLNFNYPISEQLYQVYDFIFRELVGANISKDQKRIEGILPIIKELRDTWEQATCQGLNFSEKADVISV